MSDQYGSTSGSRPDSAFDQSSSRTRTAGSFGAETVGAASATQSSSGGGSSRGGSPMSGAGTAAPGSVGEAVGVVKGAAGRAQEKVGSAVSSGSEKAGQMGEQASSKVDAGIDKAASGLDTLAGTIRDKSQSVGSGSLQSVATTAADKLQTGAEALRGKDTDQLMTELEALVRRKPVESMLVAAGVGFLLSRALR